MFHFRSLYGYILTRLEQRYNTFLTCNDIKKKVITFALHVFSNLIIKKTII